MGMKRNRISTGNAAFLAVMVLLLGSVVLGPGGIDAFPTMGKNCSNCHSGGSSGVVETRDATGAAKTAFSVSPSGKLNIVILGSSLPDSGAFVALLMGSSYGIVESFDGATASPDPGTLYVVNNEINDLDSGDGAIRASMNLTIKSTTAEGIYTCDAILGYEGPQGIKQSSAVAITVAAAPADTPPVFGNVDFPASVPLNTPIPVLCPIADDGGVTTVILSYKGPGAAVYTTVDLTMSSGNAKDGVWEEEIPGQTVAGTLYFNINATDGAFFVSSPNGSAGKDHAVQVLAPGNPQIAHQPVSTAYIGSDIHIEANVTDAGTGVRLFYKDVGASSFSSVTMNRTSGGSTGPASYAAVIPAQTRKGSVSYYINATNGTQGLSTIEYSITVLSLWEPEIVHVPTTSAYTGAGIVLSASAKNSAAVTLWYKGVGDATFRSQPMDRVGGGANGYQDYSTVLPAQSAPGSMSYYMNATNGTLFNSTKVFPVQVAEALDLVLLKVSFSTSDPTVHEELVIKAKVWNNSSRELSGIQVSFLDEFYPSGDAQYIGLVSNLTIPKNGTIDVRAWWLPQENGTHRIKVKVDSTGVVNELDEKNNELVTAASVGPAKVEGFALPTAAEFLGLWPVWAVLAGVVIGAAAYLARRKTPGQ